MILSPVTPSNDAVQRIVGPWLFSFTLPVLPVRVAEVNQTVAVSGSPTYFQQGKRVARCDGCPPVDAESMAVRLERVSVTASETRVYLRLPAAQGLLENRWTPIVRVGGAGWDSHQGPRGSEGGRPMPDGLYVYSFSNSFYDRHGEWTLTVEELVGELPQPGALQIRVSGPWIFRFVVP